MSQFNLLRTMHRLQSIDPPACCNGDCRQGRDCPKRLGRDLVQEEGGEEVDTALYTPEQLSAAVPVCIWIGASVCALLCVLTRIGAFDGLINSILR